MAAIGGVDNVAIRSGALVFGSCVVTGGEFGNAYGSSRGFDRNSAI
jgi:hypothetical protein